MKNKIIEGYLKNFIEDNGNFGENSEDIIFEHLINYLIVKKCMKFAYESLKIRPSFYTMCVVTLV